MVINYLASGGGGAIKPAIPEQYIDYVILGSEPNQYVRIRNVDLTGLAGEYTVPEYIEGLPVKELAFGKNSVFGSVYHVIIPFVFKGWKDWDSNYRAVLLKAPAILTVNAISGYTGSIDVGGGFLPNDSGCVIFNIIGYVAQDPTGVALSENLQKLTAKKLSWNAFPSGNYANLIVDDEYYFSNFSIIGGKFGNLRVDKLRLTACTQITHDEAFRYASFSELYLDNYVGDNNKANRFANNSALTTIYAPALATVSNSDFANCPNMAHIYTDSSNVQILKDELSNKGYSGLVDLVEAI